MIGVYYPASRVTPPPGEAFFIEKGEKMREGRPITVLDLSSFDDARPFLALFPVDERLYVKIGAELYYIAGPEIVRYVKSLGHSVSLDLKLHDTPSTVRSATRVLPNLGVDMTNVHATGGVKMMRAAREDFEQGPKLIAVTQLTLMSDEQMKADQSIQTSLVESILYHTKKTNEAGLDGVVCPAHEAVVIKGATSEDFVCLTPGIRPTGAVVDDQKRVTTPSRASAIDSSYTVVRRPVTKAGDPVAAYKAIYGEQNVQYWNTKIVLGLVWS